MGINFTMRCWRHSCLRCGMKASIKPRGTGIPGTFISSDGVYKMRINVANEGVGIKNEYSTRDGSDMLDAIVELSEVALPQFGTLKRGFGMFPTHVEELGE